MFCSFNQNTLTRYRAVEHDTGNNKTWENFYSSSQFERARDWNRHFRRRPTNSNIFECLIFQVIQSRLESARIQKPKMHFFPLHLSIFHWTNSASALNSADVKNQFSSTASMFSLVSRRRSPLARFWTRLERSEKKVERRQTQKGNARRVLKSYCTHERRPGDVKPSNIKIEWWMVAIQIDSKDKYTTPQGREGGRKNDGKSPSLLNFHVSASRTNFPLTLSQRALSRTSKPKHEVWFCNRAKH